MTNPISLYAESYRQMQRQGAQTFNAWSIIHDIERNMAPYGQQLVDLQKEVSELQEIITDLRAADEEMSKEGSVADTLAASRKFDEALQRLFSK